MAASLSPSPSPSPSSPCTTASSCCAATGALVDCSGCCASTPVVDLSARGLTSANLSAAVFSRLTGLRALYLQSNALEALPAGIFAANAALESLYLYYNALSSLPAGLFDALPALAYVDISGNSLTTLPSCLFCNNRALVTAVLGCVNGAGCTYGDAWTGNSFTSLPTALFPPAGSALQTLRIECNRAPGLTAISSSLFANLTQLATLSLSRNYLSSLPIDMFSSTPVLQTLYLRFNALSSLPAGLFDALPALAYIDVSGNSLPTLPPCLFCKNLALATTILGWDNYGGCTYGDAWTGNSFEFLPALLFPSSGSAMQSLQIECNRAPGLSAINASLFANLTRLTTLNLMWNTLSSLPVDMFSSTPAMQNLNLRFNALSSLPAGLFDALPALAYIDISGNSLPTLPPCLFCKNLALATAELGRDNYGGCTYGDTWTGNSFTSLPAALFPPRRLGYANTENRMQQSAGARDHERLPPCESGATYTD